MSMKLYIVPDCDRPSHWSFRWEGDTELLGSFPSVDATLEASKLFLNCEVVPPKALPKAIPLATAQSLEARLANLGMLLARG